MIQAKKRLPRAANARAFRKHLDYLYARRSTIDALIESLQAYQHSRSKPVEFRRCKSA
jgi:hypothetical protein